MKVLVAQLCPTICDPMACGASGSSVRGMKGTLTHTFFFLLAAPHSMQALSSPTRDRTCTPAVEAQIINQWAAREVHIGTQIEVMRRPRSGSLHPQIIKPSKEGEEGIGSGASEPHQKCFHVLRE